MIDVAFWPFVLSYGIPVLIALEVFILCTPLGVREEKGCCSAYWVLYFFSVLCLAGIPASSYYLVDECSESGNEIAALGSLGCIAALTLASLLILCLTSKYGAGWTKDVDTGSSQRQQRESIGTIETFEMNDIFTSKASDVSGVEFMSDNAAAPSTPTLEGAFHFSLDDTSGADANA